MAQVSSRLLITLGRTNNIRSEDPSFVGLAMRPLSISLLCAVCDGVQFGRRPIWSIPGSLGKDQEQGRRNREARPAFGLTITWQPIWSIYKVFERLFIYVVLRIPQFFPPNLLIVLISIKWIVVWESKYTKNAKISRKKNRWNRLDSLNYLMSRSFAM